jgi:hypothetical protein
MPSDLAIQCWISSLPSPPKRAAPDLGKQSEFEAEPSPSSKRRRVALSCIAGNGAGRKVDEKKLMEARRGRGVEDEIRDLKRRTSPRKRRVVDSALDEEEKELVKENEAREEDMDLEMSAVGREAGNRYAHSQKEKIDHLQGKVSGREKGQDVNDDDGAWDSLATPRAPNRLRQDYEIASRVETSSLLTYQSRPHHDIPPIPDAWATALANAPVETSPTPRRRASSSRKARSAASTSSSTTDSQRSKSKSPSRTAADLLPAGITVGPIKDIPADIAQLYQRMAEIRDQYGFIPVPMKEEIALSCGPIRTVRRTMLWNKDNTSTPPYTTNDPHTRDEDLQKRELKELLYIQHEAEECSADDAFETAWNVKVHGRLLAVVLQRQRYSPIQYPSHKPQQISYEVITHATICPSFLPTSHSTGQTQSARIVDFTLNLDPGNDVGGIRLAIVDLVNRQPVETRTINQSMCGSLRYKPCTVAIETKAKSNSSGSGDGCVQLALWASAQFIRLRKLYHSRHEQGDAESEYKSITLPLIRTAGHYWYFLFAVERPPTESQQQHTFEILGEVGIGHTMDLMGMYSLLAALQALVDWSVDVYAPWFRTQILGLPS